MPTHAQGLECLTTKPKDYTKNGKCIRCGECCTNMMPLSRFDINRIKNYVRANKIKPVSHANPLLATPSLDMVCPFLDTRKNPYECTIYAVRPMLCEAYSCHFHSDAESQKASLEKMANNPLTAREVATSKMTDLRATFFPETVEKTNQAIQARLAAFAIHNGYRGKGFK